MAESFENLDNILRDRVKDKVQKKYCRDIWTGTRSRRKKEKAVCRLENYSEKVLKQSQSTVERD